MITIPAWMAFLPVAALIAGMVLMWWVKRRDFGDGWQEGRTDQALHIGPEDEAEYYFHDLAHCKGACGRHGLPAAGRLGTWSPRQLDTSPPPEFQETGRLPTAAERTAMLELLGDETSPGAASGEAPAPGEADEDLSQSTDYAPSPVEGTGGIRREISGAGPGTGSRPALRAGRGRADRRDWHKQRGPYAAALGVERLADTSDDLMIRAEDERAWWASVAADPGLRQIELVHA